MLLDKAAGENVVYENNRYSRNLTQQKFREQNLWNGNPSEWNSAWNKYWSTGNRDLNYPRNRIGTLFTTTPQEAFATLANLYVTNSYLFLEQAKLRYDRGLVDNINAFLLYVDYYSRGTNRLKFVQSSVNGEIVSNDVSVTRNAQDYVIGLDFNNGHTVNFSVDENGWVNSSFKTPSLAQMIAKPVGVSPLLVINRNVMANQSVLATQFSHDSNKFSQLFDQYKTISFRAYNGYWVNRLFLPNNVDEGRRFVFKRQSGYGVELNVNGQKTYPANGEEIVYVFTNGRWIVEDNAQDFLVINRDVAPGHSDLYNQLYHNSYQLSQYFNSYKTISFTPHNGYWVRRLFLPNNVVEGRRFIIKRLSGWPVE